MIPLQYFNCSDILLLFSTTCCWESGTSFFGGFTGRLLSRRGPSLVDLGSAGSDDDSWIGSMVVGVVVSAFLFTPFFVYNRANKAILLLAPYFWLQLSCVSCSVHSDLPSLVTQASWKRYEKNIGSRSKNIQIMLVCTESYRKTYGLSLLYEQRSRAWVTSASQDFLPES